MTSITKRSQRSTRLFTITGRRAVRVVVHLVVATAEAPIRELGGGGGLPFTFLHYLRLLLFAGGQTTFSLLVAGHKNGRLICAPLQRRCRRCQDRVSQPEISQSLRRPPRVK